MAVMSVFGGQVKPGRFDDVVEMGRSASKIVERHGAKHPRILTTALGVETYGGVVHTTLFDSLKAYGAFYDKINGDKEVVDLLSELRGANSPYLAMQATVANEIPLGPEPSDARGSVISVARYRLVPGMFKEAVEAMTASRNHQLVHGAINSRLWVYYAAGSLMGTFVAGTEYDSMEAYGEASESLNSDSEGRHLLKRALSADYPLTLLSGLVLTEIPL